MSVYNPLTNRDEITGLTHNSTWNDVDVSSKIGAGAVGVAVLVYNSHASSAYSFGVRKNGSTDNYLKPLNPSTTGFVSSLLFVGVDGSGILEINSQNSALKYFIVGYFDSPAVFFTNWPVITGSNADAWNDVDITSHVGGDAGNINCALMTVNAYNEGKLNYSYGVRENGSTTTDFSTWASGRNSFIVGVDASDIFELWSDENNYLVGYIPNGDDEYVPLNPRPVFNTVTPDAWTEYDVSTHLDDPTAYAVMSYMVRFLNNACGIREDGSTDAVVSASDLPYITKINPSDQVIEYYTADDDTLQNIVFMGYFRAPLPETSNVLVKSGGVFSPITPNIKISGTFVEKPITLIS